MTQIKTMRDDENDRWRVRARRITVPVITEPVAIVRGTPNPEAARAFVDFLVSEAGQQLSADLGYLPLSDTVTPPAGFVPLSTITVLHADAADLAASREADKERFAELFGE